jgi:hypothetical protein
MTGSMNASVLPEPVPAVTTKSRFSPQAVTKASCWCW